jgi:hypothetical protein
MKTLERFYRNPAVMVPWCERVGLDPARIRVSDFSIEHRPDGSHEAAYTELLDPIGQGEELRRWLTVDVLPFPCALHPEVPAVGAENGIDRQEWAS